MYVCMYVCMYVGVYVCMYVCMYVFPTLDKLLMVLRDEINFCGGRSTLFCFLKKLGFKYKKQDERKFLVERPEVVMLRHRKMKKIRKEKPAANIFYLDETWINSNNAPKKYLVDKDNKGGVKIPLGKLKTHRCPC